jgi:hypothetical protein
MRKSSSDCPSADTLCDKDSRNKTTDAGIQTSPKRKASEQFLWFAFSLLLIAVSYGPILCHDYAFADDFYYLGARLSSPDWFTSMLATSALQGRPLNGLLLGFGMIGFNSLSDFLYFHALAVLFTALLAFMIYHLANEAGWTKTQSFCLGLALVSLPPFQVILAWSVTTFYVLAIIFALISVRTVAATKLRHLKSGITFAIVFLLLAMIIYQPASMFYWTFAAIFLTGDSLNDKARRSALVQLSAVFLLAAFLDLMVFEIAKLHYGTAALLPQRSHLTTHPGQKFFWFFNGPLLDALNFNNLIPSRRLAALAGLFILSGLWLHFKHNEKQTKLSALYAILPLVVAIVIIPLAYVPNLAIAETFYTYRTELGLSALILFYAFLSSKAFLIALFPKHATHALTCLMAVSTTLCLYTAHAHVRDFFVNPQLLEQKQIKSQLMGKFGRERQKQPAFLDRNQTLAPFIRYDEFGLPSFSCSWVKEPGVVLLRREIEKGATE